jgi:hypothetical protein
VEWAIFQFNKVADHHINNIHSDCMQDPTNKNIEKESKFKLSTELINGYYLSFLAIGLLSIILRNDLSNDHHLKQALFFILMVLIFGSINLLQSAASKESNQNKKN